MFWVIHTTNIIELLLCAQKLGTQQCLCLPRIYLLVEGHREETNTGQAGMEPKQETAGGGSLYGFMSACSNSTMCNGDSFPVINDPANNIFVTHIWTSKGTDLFLSRTANCRHSHGWKGVPVGDRGKRGAEVQGSQRRVWSQTGEQSTTRPFACPLWTSPCENGGPASNLTAITRITWHQFSPRSSWKRQKHFVLTAIDSSNG